MNELTLLPQSDNRKPTLRENFVDFLMNTQTLFSITSQSFPKLKNPKSVQLFVLGKEFHLAQGIDPKTINKSIENYFYNIIWFSYRRNFPILKPKTEKTYISDTGWGCSLRVGQMILAEVLKRHLQDGNRFDKLIGFFNDCELDPLKAPFSIQQITIASFDLFKLTPGSWFRFTHIMMLFENLYQNFAKVSMPNLEFLLFPDGILFFNQVYEKMTSYSECSNCNKKPTPPIFKEKLCKTCKKFNKSLFLLICMMPSLNKLRLDDFEFIFTLMSSPFSVGMMGGKPKRAKYFVSMKDGYLICKDPHYVQEAIPDNKEISSYFTNEIKYVDIRKMASSLAFGFYFRNEIEFEEFEDFLRKNREKMGERWLLSFDEEFREKEFMEGINQQIENKEFEKNEYDNDENDYEEYEKEEEEKIDVNEENSLVVISKNFIFDYENDKKEEKKPKIFG